MIYMIVFGIVRFTSLGINFFIEINLSLYHIWIILILFVITFHLLLEFLHLLRLLLHLLHQSLNFCLLYSLLRLHVFFENIVWLLCVTPYIGQPSSLRSSLLHNSVHSYFIIWQFSLSLTIAFYLNFLVNMFISFTFTLAF